MTTGEISRSLARLERSQHEQTVKLDEIKSQTVKTNGYVGRHEERLNGLDREILDLKGRRVHAHDQRRADDHHDAITFSIPTTTKTVTLVLTVAGGIIAAAFTAALKLWGVL